MHYVFLLGATSLFFLELCSRDAIEDCTDLEKERVESELQFLITGVISAQ
jgi:hypothetical protein